jgi:hypothetical protein
MRAVNVPPRGVGEKVRRLRFAPVQKLLKRAKTLTELRKRAEELGLSQLEVVERIHDSKVQDVASLKRKLARFVGLIRKFRLLAADVCILSLYQSPISDHSFG